MAILINERIYKKTLPIQSRRLMTTHSTQYHVDAGSEVKLHAYTNPATDTRYKPFGNDSHNALKYGHVLRVLPEVYAKTF